VSGMDRDEGSEAGARVPSWARRASARRDETTGWKRADRETILTYNDSKGTCTHRMASDALV
jgi:hypothetical protein